MGDVVTLKLNPSLAQAREQTEVDDLMRMLRSGVSWRRVYAAFGGKAACDEVMRRAEECRFIEIETHPDGWRDIQLL